MTSEKHKQAQKRASDKYRKSKKGKRTHRIYARIYRASGGKGGYRRKIEIEIPVQPLNVPIEVRFEFNV